MAEQKGHVHLIRIGIRQQLTRTVLTFGGLETICCSMVPMLRSKKSVMVWYVTYIRVQAFLPSLGDHASFSLVFDRWAVQVVPFPASVGNDGSGLDNHLGCE